MEKQVRRSGARVRPSCVAADDHQAVLASLALLLEHEGLSVVGTAATAAEATRLIELHQPDLAVVDFRFPDGTGLDVARGAAAGSPATRVVLHLTEAHSSIVDQALAAGVRAIALKAVPPTQLLAAAAAALAGEIYVDPVLAGRSPSPGSARVSEPSCR